MNRNQNQIQKRIAMAALLLAVSISGSSNALTPSPAEEGRWYYEIGGAQAVTVPPNPVISTVTLGGSASLGIGYSCGKFDPVLSISNTLNDIGDGVDSMLAQMVSAATASLAALPALILQRANPGLYDLFQNALLQAEERFQLATKTCEQMEAEINAGQNPFDSWVVLSKGNDWKVQMGAGGVDIVDARNQVESAAGENGLPWVAGNYAGGKEQAPIQVINDTAKAGFNVIMGRPVHAGGTVASGASAPRLAQIWNNPVTAGRWTAQVLGDTVVRTCDGCARQSVPGNGLLPIHDKATEIVQTDLLELVSGATSWTPANLETVSAPGIAITRQVVESIRLMTPREQGMYIGKLAGEIALARVVEQALMARRLLLAGRRETNIAANGEAQREISVAVGELNQEIDNLLFETRIRREVVSGTVVNLLNEAQRRKGQSLTIPVTTYQDPKPVMDGGGVVP